MKTISFFNEKGGVGKSSFSILYASWLKYRHGLKVGLADFNGRIAGYRRGEIRERNRLIEQNPDKGILPYDESKTWPIVAADYGEIMKKAKEYNSEMPNAAWLEYQLKEGKLKDMDVVLCDFPGSITGKEYIHVAVNKLLSLTVIPTEKEEQTLQATIGTYNMNKELMVPQCIFINKAETRLRNLSEIYFKLVPALKKRGMAVLPDLISRSERMNTIDRVDIIRSTFYFPDFDSKEFSGSRDLGIGNLFIDITRLLARQDDIEGTPSTDLSFVDALQKTDDGRQATGSAFPEFEIRK